MKKTVVLLLVLALVFGIVAGCDSTPADVVSEQGETEESSSEEESADEAKEEQASEEAEDEGMLLLQVPQNMSEIFPPVWDNYGGITRFMIFSRLLLTNNKEEPVEFDLAEDVQISEDELEYVYTLRDGVKWHDGEDFSAQDVVTSFKLAVLGLDLNSVIRNAFAAIEGYDEFIAGEDMNADFEGISVDGNVITFSLSKLSSTFLLSTSQFNILPHHLVKDTDPSTFKTNEFFQSPIGTGPYYVKEFVPNDYMLLERFDDYFGEPAGIKYAKLSYFEQSDYVLRAQTDELDYAQTTSADDAEEIAKLENYTVVRIPVYFNRYFLANMNSFGGRVSPVADIRVREAILHAIDREAMCANILKNGTVSNSSIPSTYDFYWDGGNKYEYDPDKALELLNEAGFDFSQEIIFANYSGQQASADMVDATVAYLSAIGVKASWFQMTGDLTTQIYNDPQYDIIYMGLSAMSAEEALNLYHSETIATSNWKGLLPEGQYGFDEWVDALNETSDTAERKDILIELQKLEQENLWKLPIGSQDSYIIINHSRIEVPGQVSNEYFNYQRNMHEWKFVG